MFVRQGAWYRFGYFHLYDMDIWYRHWQFYSNDKDTISKDTDTYIFVTEDLKEFTVRLSKVYPFIVLKKKATKKMNVHVTLKY